MTSSAGKTVGMGGGGDGGGNNVPRTERPPSVAVIGAGGAGLAAGRLLRAEGLRVTIFDKAEDLGGVWQYRAEPEARAPMCEYEFCAACLREFAGGGEARLYNRGRRVIMRCRLSIISMSCIIILYLGRDVRDIYAVCVTSICLALVRFGHLIQIAAW